MNKFLVSVIFVTFSFIANSQTVDFTFSTSNGLYCNPSIVDFTPIVSGSPTGYVWNFGNGTITNDQNPEVVFDNPGTYNVKLIVVYKNNAVAITKPIVINPVVKASITTDRNFICKPGDISFTGNATGNMDTYIWDFGDSSGIVSGLANTITHNFTAKQVYNVTLNVVDSSGCNDTVTTTVTLADPILKGTISPVNGCIPASATLNSTATIPANSTITSYNWDFGDGNNNASSNNISNHVYTKTGNYSPSVMITTSEGCTGSFKFSGVAFGTPPTNHVAYPEKTVICGSESAILHSKATLANSYLWDFGDGTSATVLDTITKHKFTSLGLKTVSVTPAFNGCRGTTITFTVEVVGVIANYNYSNVCADKNTFNFTNKSLGNLSLIEWNFGDSSPVVNSLDAVHTFAPSTVSTTTLIVLDSVTMCSDTTARILYTAKPTLVNTDSSLCRNSTTTFTLLNTYNNPSATYTWNVTGSKTSATKDTSYTTTASILGNFNNSVIITNGAGYCQDTIYLDHKILIRGPALSFESSPAICFDSLFTVKNTSYAFVPADSIISWYWNFGAGTTSYNVYQPEAISYNKHGTYNVKLIATDIRGCTDSLVKTVTINSLPFVQTIPSLDTICVGRPDTLIAFHNNTITWSSPGTLSCSTCDTVLANPSVSTKYIVTATNSYGCTSRDSVMAMAYPDFAATPESRDFYICQKDTAVLKVDPPMKQITWNPSTSLSSANSYDPLATPLQTTTYTATLTDSAGCFSKTTDITVHVKSPPTVDAGPDQIYPFNTSFSIHPTYSSNVVSYEWTPSDLLSCTSCAYPNGVSTESQSYQIKVTSDSGCVAKDSISIFIECKESYIYMPTAFTPNGDGLNDFYFPSSRGIKTIVKFTIYDRFGKVVYEAKNFPPNDKTFGWDGKIKSQSQSSEVFVYYIQALCDLGQTVFKKGSFVLLK